MTTTTKRPRVVPALVLGASFIGVVPACALGACGGQTSGGDAGTDAQQDTQEEFLGVFAVAYCCFDAAVEADTNDATNATDGHEGG